MATILRSWTSETGRRLGLALLVTLAIVPAAHAWPFKGKAEPEPAPAQERAPEPPPPAPSPFDAPLPLALGAAPSGLASTSAQACNACHFAAHDGWEGSAHAVGWSSPAFREAVAEAGTPACAACHLPLMEQQPERWTYDDDRVDRPVTAPNPDWDATLATEGVTCAACHVRDGVVLAASPPAPDTVAPHPLGWTPDLASSEGCAACHQLTWPGADQPFYDTFGEWQRSPQAAAGIRCQDCHMGAGAAEQRIGADHRIAAAPERAVSVLVDLPGPDLLRGAEPLPATVRLQNTGAGHAFPTGSPFRGVRMRVTLDGPEDARVEVLSADLARTLEDAPPWRTTGDTRLQAGEERAWDLALALDQDAPAGDWVLRVALLPTVRGEVGSEVLLERAVPLRVE